MKCQMAIMIHEKCTDRIVCYADPVGVVHEVTGHPCPNDALPDEPICEECRQTILKQREETK
jgi:hypothetical protein